MNQKVVTNACVYTAVTQAEEALGRTLEKCAREELLKTIEEAGIFPLERVRELPRILESMGPFRVYGAFGPEPYDVQYGKPVIVAKKTGLPYKNEEMGHAEFGFANEQLLSGEIAWLIVFERPE